MNESNKAETASLPKELLSWWVIMGSISYLSGWTLFVVCMFSPESRADFMSASWQVFTTPFLICTGLAALLVVAMTIGADAGNARISGTSEFPGIKRYWYAPFLAMIAPIVIVVGIVALTCLIVRARQRVVVV